MKDRSILSAAILIVFLFATNCKAQTYSAESIPRFAAFVPEVKNPATRTAPAAPIRTKEISDARTLSAVRFHKKQFLILAATLMATRAIFSDEMSAKSELGIARVSLY
jgi:hypothetical protein